MRKHALLIIAIALAFCSPLLWADKPKIAWFSTLKEDTSEKSGFWKRVHNLVLSAAEDLDVDFQVYYAEENFIKLKEQVSAVLKDPSLRPDGIIFHNYKQTGEFILQQAEIAEVKSVIFNSGLQDDKSHLRPREQYQHWLGEILPNDSFSGAELLRHLKEEASSQTNSERKLEVVAMAGNPSSAAYQARRKGLLAELERSPNLEFHQFIPADWSRETAYKQLSVINKRYPNNYIFWAANDNMALGLLDKAKEIGLQPNKDFITGGIDWLPEALEKVAAGDMHVSIGGHFVEGMWAIVLLYDYLKGKDFKERYGTSIKTKMLALTKANLEYFGDINAKFEIQNLRNMDFQKLSLSDNTELIDYPFDIEYLLNAITIKPSESSYTND